MHSRLLFGQDWDVIVSTLDEVVPMQPITLLEIGCAEGYTSRSIMDELDRRQVEYTYYAIDPMLYRPLDVQHPRFHFIKGFSSDQPVLDAAPALVHWLFVDGCHCEICARRDITLYFPRVCPGGLALVHDTAPDTQGLDPQHYQGAQAYHDHEKAKVHGIQVLKALDAVPAGFTLTKAALPQGTRRRAGLRAHGLTRLASFLHSGRRYGSRRLQTAAVEARAGPRGASSTRGRDRPRRTRRPGGTGDIAHVEEMKDEYFALANRIRRSSRRCTRRWPASKVAPTVAARSTADRLTRGVSSRCRGRRIV
jgi:hypothetical protein